MTFARFTAGPRVACVALMVLSQLSGCSQKKEQAEPAKPAQQTAPAPSKEGDAQVSQAPQAVPTPQDEADARVLKDRVLAQVKSGDFPGIYKEASSGFKEVGPEEQFLALWQKQMQQTGAFRDAKQMSQSVRPEDKFLVFIYHVQYEKAKKELRLTFGRSKKGKMELTGINQRDIR